MKNQLFPICMAFLLLPCLFSYTQEIEQLGLKGKVTELFLDSEVLPIQLKYSNNELRKITSDGSYADSKLLYQIADTSWNSIDIKLRVRGNNRLKNCHYAPIKIKIKKSKALGTLFEGNKNLKLVLPCFRKKNQNDNVLKEYLAYRLYEIISPYHFKTRLLNIELIDPNGSKEKKEVLKGFFIEDIDNIAKRFDAHVVERKTHPLNLDDQCSVENCLFQYMIGNTDYSVAYQHNQKLLFVEKRMIPVPYDFDMSGFVNANYATVSNINMEILPIKSVRQRLYRGFQWDASTYYAVRQKFLLAKEKMFEILDQSEMEFEDHREYMKTRSYIESFFEVLLDPNRFEKEIIQKARTE